MDSKEVGVDKRRRLIPGETKARRARAWEAVGHARGHAKSLQSCPTLCNPMDCSPPGSSVLGKEVKEKIPERSQVPAQDPVTKAEEGVKGGEKKGSERTQMEELVGNCRSKDNWMDSVASALWTGHEDDLGWTLGGCGGPMCLRQGVCRRDKPSRESWCHRRGELNFVGDGDPRTSNLRGGSIFPLNFATRG